MMGKSLMWKALHLAKPLALFTFSDWKHIRKCFNMVEGDWHSIQCIKMSKLQKCYLEIDFYLSSTELRYFIRFCLPK